MHSTLTKGGGEEEHGYRGYSSGHFGQEAEQILGWWLAMLLSDQGGQMLVADLGQWLAISLSYLGKRVPMADPAAVVHHNFTGVCFHNAARVSLAAVLKVGANLGRWGERGKLVSTWARY